MAERITDIFVGRQSEISRLTTLREKTREAAGSVVIVTGEAGIGKTGLMDCLSKEVANSGATIIRDSFLGCQAVEPYSPFIRIAEHLAQSEAKRENGTNTDSGQAPQSVSSLEALYTLQKRQSLAQQHLAVSIFEAAAQHQMVMIALDDAESAPLSTWKFIHYLSESVSSKGILLILNVTQKGPDLRRDSPSPYVDVMQRMNREGLYEEIKLDRLNEDEVLQCLNVAFPVSDFSASLAKKAYEISHGNPAQLARFLDAATDGELVYERNGIWFDQAEVACDFLTELMSDEHELEQAKALINELPENQQRLLNVAALINGPFDHRVLGQITGQSHVQVIKALMALREKHIVTPIKEDFYQFKAPATRMLLLKSLSEEKERELHLVIASKVEASDQLSRAERMAMLAYHYSRTDDTDAAFQYLNEAGLLALSNFAFQEAKEHFEQALKQWPETGEPAEGTRIEILLRLAWLNHVLGHWENALELCERARPSVSEAHDPQLEIQLQIQMGLTYFRRNDWQNALGCFHNALERQSNVGRFERAMVNYGLGDVNFEIGEYALARHHFEEALTIARELDKKQLMASILNNLGALENLQSQHLKAIALYSESTAICNALGDHLGLARVFHNLGMSHAEQTSWAEADEFYGKSLSVSERLGLRPLKSIAFLNRALALAKLGRFDDARQFNHKALRLLEQLEDDLGIAEYHKIQGIIERKQDHWQASREQLEKGMQRFEALGNKLGVAETLFEFALLANSVGEKDEWKNCLHRAAATYRELGLKQRADAIEVEFVKSEATETKVEDQS